jgi:hypothetical protein
MNEQTEITIDFKDIPEVAGRIVDSPHGTRTIIFSMSALKTWVLKKLPNLPSTNVTISVQGSMSNCVALHMGVWLAGCGTIVFKSNTGFKRVVY